MMDTAVQCLTNQSQPIYTYPTTSNYAVTVEWKAENITSGAFRQSVHDGDHKHLCTAASGAIYPEHKGRSKQITVRG